MSNESYKVNCVVVTFTGIASSIPSNHQSKVISYREVSIDCDKNESTRSMAKRAYLALNHGRELQAENYDVYRVHSGSWEVAEFINGQINVVAEVIIKP